MAPTHPEWNQETGGKEVAAAFADQIREKNVLITGISPDSIGSSMASSIASQSPALLILASRTPSNLNNVAQSIRDEYPTVNIRTVLLDLMSQESVKKAAEAVLQLIDKLDVIINNAGIMTPNKVWTVEKIEGQFGANHIGHFLFTNILMPLLKNSATQNTPGSTRVVNLTSLGHRLSPIRFHDYNFEGKEIPDDEHPPSNLPLIFQAKGEDGYNGYIAYGQAKAANVLFSVYLTQKLKEKGIVSYAVHPGSIWTGLSRDLDSEGQAAIKATSTFWKNHDQGAATALVAAFDPGLSDPPGVLMHNCQMCDPAPHANNLEVAERLWGLSEKLVGIEFRV
ncbi:short chain dehydrogenase/ reductase-like protein [Delitschia confertaspora ATCC 74209]|uniref:Short chain dehydrogenase/ reductase-like protein n=1 Tax=Delitschia confertaspora ATCC 74209 TaxID=1513339 RepID=A0A9P4JMW6_9PLEO|nr:short chain dehydrogenase/ reductase-like protein [Delitschia confertaspora ATCC 74209]